MDSSIPDRSGSFCSVSGALQLLEDALGIGVVAAKLLLKGLMLPAEVGYDLAAGGRVLLVAVFCLLALRAVGEQLEHAVASADGSRGKDNGRHRDAADNAGHTR